MGFLARPPGSVRPSRPRLYIPKPPSFPPVLGHLGVSGSTGAGFPVRALRRQVWWSFGPANLQAI